MNHLAPLLQLIGPVTASGDVSHAKQKMTTLKLRLQGAGFRVFSPSDHPPALSEAQYMRLSLTSLPMVDFAVVLPGYRASLGSSAEIALARKLGIPLIELDALRGHGPTTWQRARRLYTSEAAA